MKKTITFLLLFIIVFATCLKANAQTFTIISDTIYITSSPGTNNYFDSIVTGSAPVTYSWKVIDCNFPVSWMSPAVSGFCDNAVCRLLWALWPSGYQDTTTMYAASDTGTLALGLDLPAGASSGCYYVTTRLHNIAIYSDSTTETWFVCYTPAGIPTITNPSSTSLTLFPNPNHGTFTLNVSSSQKEDATIIMTNILGEKVKELTTNTNTEIQMDISPGIYFVTAVTAQGRQCTKVVVE